MTGSPPLPVQAHGSQFHPASVLLVEDNLADVRLTVELLREAKLANRLRAIADGAEALVHLRAALDDAGTPLPDLVLLDLQLPGMDGRELLRHIRSEPRLRNLCVFILTASATHSEMVREEGLQADGYLEKPIDLGAFVRELCRLDRFWLQLVSLPTS